MAVTYRVYRGPHQTQVVSAGKEITLDSPGTGADIGKHPVAEVMVSKTSEQPNFNPHTGPVQGIANHNGLSSSWNDAHDDWEETRTDHHPTELFTHRPPQVSYAFSDPSMRHTIPTMVGLALQHDPPGMASGKIMADASLTEHSSRLSRKAAERGLNIVADPNNPTMEGYGDDFHPRTMWMHDVERQYPDEVGPEQVGAARQWVRDKVRPPAKEPKRGKPMDDLHPVIQPAMFDFKGDEYAVSEAAQGLTASGTRPGWTSMARRDR